MRRIQLALVGILAVSSIAQAQGWGRNDRNNDYRGDNGRYGQQRGNGNRYDVIDRAQADINRLARTPLDKRDFGRVNELTRNLQQFEARMAQGRFDKDRLDQIIETMNNLANSNRLPQAVRYQLYRDVDDLRQFRANRGLYSSRF